MNKQRLLQRFSWLGLAAFVPFLLSGQTPVVNSSFENWSSKTLFEYPTSWFTDVSPSTASSSTIKDKDAPTGNYSLRLTTVENSGSQNPVPVGYAVLGEFIYEFPPKGIPWSQTVETFQVDIKYNIGQGDAGLIWIRMTKDEQVVSNTLHPITGSEDSWTPLSISLDAGPVTPDSIMIGIVSSIPEQLNIPFLTPSPVIGSWIMIDNLRFTNGSNTYPVPNSGFENWENYTIEEPDGWTSSNQLLTYDQTSNVQKITDASSGNFAVELTTTAPIFPTEVIPGRLSYGTALLREGGVPYTDTPLFFSGDYMFSPNGSDQATIEVYFNEDSEWVARAAIDITGTHNTYTHFDKPITFPNNASPDRVFINIYSGANAGSVLKVDNLMLTNVSTGLNNPGEAAQTSFYPNPFKEVIYLNNPQEVKRVTFSNLLGQVIYEVMTSGTQPTIATGHLPKGQYLITMELMNGTRVSEMMMRE